MLQGVIRRTCERLRHIPKILRFLIFSILVFTHCWTFDVSLYSIDTIFSCLIYILQTYGSRLLFRGRDVSIGLIIWHPGVVGMGRRSPFCILNDERNRDFGAVFYDFFSLATHMIMESSNGEQGKKDAIDVFLLSFMSGVSPTRPPILM